MPSWARWWQILLQPLPHLSQGQFWNPSCQNPSRWSAQSDWLALLPSIHSWRDKSKTQLMWSLEVLYLNWWRHCFKLARQEAPTLCSLYKLQIKLTWHVQSYPEVTYSVTTFHSIKCYLPYLFLCTTLNLWIQIDYPVILYFAFLENMGCAFKESMNAGQSHQIHRS